jgi:hypothetical protein
MEAEGLVAEKANAVVQAFESAVREAVLDGGEDAQRRGYSPIPP